jgi:NMD protein affecting ribosome stability and mRNA decay
MGLGETKIRKYVKYQEEKERRVERDQQGFDPYRGLFSLKLPAMQVGYLICSKVFKYIWSS